MYIKRNTRYRGPRESYKIDMDRRQRVIALHKANSFFKQIESSLHSIDKDINEKLTEARLAIEDLEVRFHDIERRASV